MAPGDGAGPNGAPAGSVELPAGPNGKAIRLRCFDGDRTPGVYKSWRQEVRMLQTVDGVKDDQMAPWFFWLSLQAPASLATCCRRSTRR